MACTSYLRFKSFHTSTRRASARAFARCGATVDGGTDCSPMSADFNENRSVHWAVPSGRDRWSGGAKQAGTPLLRQVGRLVFATIRGGCHSAALRWESARFPRSRTWHVSRKMALSENFGAAVLPRPLHTAGQCACGLAPRQRRRKAPNRSAELRHGTCPGLLQQRGDAVPSA